MGGAGAVIVAFGIAAIGPVFSATLLALTLTMCVHPIQRRLEARGVPRGGATAVVVVLVLAILLGFWYGLILAVGQFAGILPQYASDLQAWLAGVGDWLVGVGFDQEQAAAVVASVDPAQLLQAAVAAVAGATGVITSTFVLITMLVAMSIDAAWMGTVTGRMRIRRQRLVVALEGAVGGSGGTCG
ncbi:hypothetical protein GCM10025870_20230 [Agromyces marinus]|uniref:AI-2E family transporter n=1 Tax=Agromyces marinus TaxID=1389020 RepID=A0ABN6YG89_9MICO|nr:AI-2E family transporter [Agromyces marinus]BDZ54950.1 hypothetical protein GCM10025870_20230 [Agromyces marinus]